MVEIYGAEAAKFVDILKEKLEQLKGVSSAGFVGTNRLQNWNVTNFVVWEVRNTNIQSKPCHHHDVTDASSPEM